MAAINQYSVASAQEAAARDDLAAWVNDFLASSGSDNELLGAQLAEDFPFWVGPVELPFEQLKRLAGPADDPGVLVPVDDDYWRDDVQELSDAIDDGAEPPPVVATDQGDHLRLEDGNHRLEALRRTGAEEAWTVVGFKSEARRDAFLATGRVEASATVD